MPNIGTTWTFDSIGSEEKFTIPVSGIYKLVVLGMAIIKQNIEVDLGDTQLEIFQLIKT